MIKYYIDDLRITIPTLEGNKEYVIALLIDENLNLVTYSFRESHAYEVMLTKAFYKLGFEPEVEASSRTERIVLQIMERLAKPSALITIKSAKSEIENDLASMRLDIDRILKSFVHEYKFNSEMRIDEKRVGIDGQLYKAVSSRGCQECHFEKDCLVGCYNGGSQLLGLGSCMRRERIKNHDSIIFKLIER